MQLIQSVSYCIQKIKLLQKVVYYTLPSPHGILSAAQILSDCSFAKFVTYAFPYSVQRLHLLYEISSVIWIESICWGPCCPGEWSKLSKEREAVFSLLLQLPPSIPRLPRLRVWWWKEFCVVSWDGCVVWVGNFSLQNLVIPIVKRILVLTARRTTE